MRRGSRVTTSHHLDQSSKSREGMTKGVGSSEMMVNSMGGSVGKRINSRGSSVGSGRGSRSNVIIIHARGGNERGGGLARDCMDIVSGKRERGAGIGLLRAAWSLPSAKWAVGKAESLGAA
jgi:hypothetical protein